MPLWNVFFAMLCGMYGQHMQSLQLAAGSFATIVIASLFLNNLNLMVFADPTDPMRVTDETRTLGVIVSSNTRSNTHSSSNCSSRDSMAAGQP